MWRTYKNVPMGITEFAETFITLDHGVYIGTDAQRKGTKWSFCTVIVSYKPGEPAVLLKKLETIPITKFRPNKHVPVDEAMRQRLSHESALSIQAADELKPLIAQDIIIHIDANESDKHKSGKFQSFMTSIVSGSGYDYEIKPKAWAAASAADHCARKG